MARGQLQHNLRVDCHVIGGVLAGRTAALHSARFRLTACWQIPSCVVIDLTLTSALYLKKRLDPSMAGMPLMRHAESHPRMRWSPLLVGNSVVERLLSNFLEVLEA
jgi:hypothetical protein